MLYALLFYSREEEWDAMERPQREKIMRVHFDEVNSANAVGALVTSMRLLPTNTATTDRADGKETDVLDGPFSETKEQLGGFQVLDCPNLDEAMRYAKMFVAHDGIRFDSVEIRPLHPQPDSID
jgi:hypothetical protein